LWKGGQVRRYSASGALDEVIELPVPKVTACTFGGPDLDQLYITTSRYGEDSPHPSAGAIFIGRPGITGLPARPFAG
jgi:sugar lactone lactonase YvrE